MWFAKRPAIMGTVGMTIPGDIMVSCLSPGTRYRMELRH